MIAGLGVGEAGEGSGDSLIIESTLLLDAIGLSGGLVNLPL